MHFKSLHMWTRRRIKLSADPTPSRGPPGLRKNPSHGFRNSDHKREPLPLWGIVDELQMISATLTADPGIKSFAAKAIVITKPDCLPPPQIL
ncbi:hypothetical protein CDAR_595961 [Caerostris darwini]|uniref:Uncharacterized protein n=1 Tax=Caerostris darwini TaxID=1538125 RepID=A0AAV4Q6G4_9ARAC|nr:hypothetical protein CDAR_595961 [Caerostris darwini]